MKKNWISPELLEKVKSSISIVDIVGEHVVLRKSGSNYSGLCPFHSERTPSFYVSETKQLFHCYGCKKGGDIIHFVTEILGVSFPEAVEDLAERSRIALPSQWSQADSVDPQVSAQREKTALAYKLNRFVAAYFHHSLDRSPQAKNYFQMRGTSPDLILEFYLGAAQDAWEGLSGHLVEKKAPLSLAVELGLIRPSQKNLTSGVNSGYYDLLRNRAIFPILNLRGKVAGFGGRALGEESPKYLNSPESLIFQKSKLAYGLFQAQKHIRAQDEVILVEGYFDVLALHALGFKNAVATCGTALTVDHLHLFRRLASRIIVLFDADAAGIEATERAMEIGLDQGIVLFGAKLPVGLDPDNLYFDASRGKPNPDAKDLFQGILGSTTALLDSQIEAVLHSLLQKSGDQTEGRVVALKKIAHWLGRLKDPVGRDLRIESLQRRLAIPRTVILEAIRETSKDFRGGSAVWVKPNQNSGGAEVFEKPAPKPQRREAAGPISASDRILMTGVLYGSEFLEVFKKAEIKLPPGENLSYLIESSSGREWLQARILGEGGLDSVHSRPEWALDQVNDPQLQSLVTEVMVSPEDSPTQIRMEDFQRALGQRLKKVWARFSQQIKKAITQAEAAKDMERYTILMKEYLDVQRKMKEFINFYDEA